MSLRRLRPLLLGSLLAGLPGLVEASDPADGGPRWIFEEACRERSPDARACIEEVGEPILDHEDERVVAFLIATRSETTEVLQISGAPTTELGRAYGRLGRIYLLYDLIDPAAASLRNAVRLIPHDERWSYYLGALEEQRGNLDLATEHLRWVLALEPENSPARLRLAGLLLIMGEHDEAKGHYRHVLDLDPSSAAAEAGLGRLALRQDRIEDAITHLERALELQPEAGSLHYLLAMAHRAGDDLERARQHLDLRGQEPVYYDDPLMQSLASANVSTWALYYLATDAVGEGKIAEAIELLEMFLAAHPDDAAAWESFGRALLLDGRTDEAIVATVRSVELAPSRPDGRRRLAALYLQQGDYEAAEHHARRLHELRPDDITAHADWAALLSEIGRLDAALAELSTLAETAPDDAYVSLRYGLLLIRRGSFEEARARLTTAVESVTLSEDSLVAAHTGLTFLAQRAGDEAETKRHLQEVLLRSPHSTNGKEP